MKKKKFYSVIILAFILLELCYGVVQLIWYNTSLSNTLEAMKYIFWCMLFFILSSHFQDKRIKISFLSLSILNLVCFVTFLIPCILTKCTPTIHFTFFIIMATELVTEYILTTYCSIRLFRKGEQRDERYCGLIMLITLNINIAIVLIMNFMILNVFLPNHIHLINQGFNIVNIAIEIYLITCWGRLLSKTKEEVLN